MADNVTFTLGADSTPPNNTVAATDELSDGSHAGLAKLLVSANGDRTFIPATAADGLLVNLGTNNDVTVTGTITAVKDLGGTATRTSVADNAADVLILAANAARFSFSVFNDSTAVLYLALGAAAATTTNYTTQVPTNSFFSDDTYAGEVRGIWASDPGTGAARVTEVT